MLSKLCVECGLCCDGSVFRFLPVEPAELEVYRALELPVVIQSGRPAMALPCTRLAGRCCPIYEKRPAGCRAYVCGLGQRLHLGELSLAAALAVVEEAHRRIETLRTLWSGEGPLVQAATTAALTGDDRLTEEGLDALAAVQEWINDRLVMD